LSSTARAHGRHLQSAPAARHEWRVIHEWFAGWRWEHHHAGELVDESLQSFETREQCTADVQRRLSGEREALSSVPADRSREHHADQIAA
jgi:hypothetical protein